MLNLREYRQQPKALADYLPWACLVAPGIVLNKDGSFQRSARFRGPDLESATESELVAVCARLNNLLRRFGSGWALFLEAERREARGYPHSDWPHPVSWLVDEERRSLFEGEGEHYENICTVTLVYLPPADTVNRVERALLERPRGQGGRTARDYLDSFVAQTDRALDLMASLMPEVAPLSNEETLTYLHGTISVKRHPVAAPEIPVYLDGLLPDSPLSGGLEPRLGDEHLRTVTVLGFPNTTAPGVLDDLNHLGLAYRWMTRFLPLDKAMATAELTRFRRQWFAKRKSVAAIVKEVMTSQESALEDSDAANKALDADAALQELGADDVSYGYLTATVTVWDKDPGRVEEKVRAVERVINGRGFVTILETLNAVDAWLGSLPGHCYANVRRPLVHSLNLAHMMPLSSVWAGPERNAHLDGAPLLYAKTSGTTPFRLVTHVGDVGHSLVVGPTGAGKSVLLAFMALQFRRYRDAQVYVFDKGGSARATTLGPGGDYLALGGDADLAFQPLARIDDDTARAWAAEWVAALLAHEKVAVTPEVKEALWSALTSLAGAPARERTLTGLSVLLQSNALKQALHPYTLDGPFGRLLDADRDRLELSSALCFEMEELMHQKSAVLPVLTYLFHRLEERFDGRPTLLILDEAWLLFDDPHFAARIREWLKVLRKRNVAVVFATQSLSDITGSSIAPTLIESCPTRIFLPNDKALDPQEQEVYRRFGLNDRQIGIIGRATPKRDYYYQSRKGNRVFELGLGPIALAFCGASSKQDHALIDRVLAEHGPDGFATAYLKERNLPWAADLLDSWPA